MRNCIFCLHNLFLIKHKCLSFKEFLKENITNMIEYQCIAIPSCNYIAHYQLLPLLLRGY